MHGGWRGRVLYWVLLPTITVAAGILGYYAYRSAAQLAALGERSIAQTTVLLVDEKVDRVEQQIIRADNAVFHLVDLEDAPSLGPRWLPLAERISPSVQSLLVIDDGGEILAYVSRAGSGASRDFLKLFMERVMPDLELESRGIGQLRHLHRSYGDESYLLSYKASRQHGRRYYLVAQHDMPYLLGDVFPTLFAEEEGMLGYNVVDGDNNLVYGSDLNRAGDYLVGRRFPTTLYGWRLQVAPKEAPLLEEQRRSGFALEMGLVVLALVIVLLGITFLFFAATKENRLNALRSEFVANVSHELKTPLSVVRMFAEMLLTKRVKSPEKEQQYLEIILRESERLSALIENVLDFSAIEKGKQTYQMKETDLLDVIQRAIDAFRFRLEQDGLELRLETSEAIPKVRIDEQAILLSVMNLLDNAVKHGGAQGPVEVIVEGGRRHVYVRVRDHGPGIPSGELRRVFERFYRVRRDSTRGSGIGLSLVKQIVEAHGGRAFAETVEGGGAQVSFSLPFSDSTFTSTSEPAPPNTPDDVSSGPV